MFSRVIPSVSKTRFVSTFALDSKPTRASPDLSLTLQAMEMRRVHRVLRHPDKHFWVVVKNLAQAGLLFVLFIFLCEETGENFAKKEAKQAKLQVSPSASDWSIPVSVPVVITCLIYAFLLVDLAVERQFILPSIMVVNFYVAMIWLGYVYDPSSVQHRGYFNWDLSGAEANLIISLVVFQLFIGLLFVMLHCVYPFLLRVLSPSWLSSSWFDLRLESEESQDQGPGEGGEERPTPNSLAFSYKPYGLFSLFRRPFCYVGEMDLQGRPHGVGEWRESSTHGEFMLGYWSRGLPVGNFRSREFGTGSLFVTRNIVYATSREESLAEVLCFPRRSLQGLRFGVCGVESCASGRFYSHLPRVNSHFCFKDLSQTSAFLEANPSPPDPRDVPGVSAFRGEEPAVGGQPSRLKASVKVTAEVLTHPSQVADVEPGEDFSSTIRVVEGGGIVVLSPLPPLRPPEPDALIFVHGYNCSVEYGLSQFAQLLSLGHAPPNVHPFLFSQSTGQCLSYFQAVRAVPPFARDLSEFIRTLGAPKEEGGGGYKNIHLLCHSMAAHLAFKFLEIEEETFGPGLLEGGSYGPRGSLRRASREPSAVEVSEGVEGGRESIRSFQGVKAEGGAHLTNLILLNADFPLKDFEAVHLPRALRRCERVTLYSDTRDRALFYAHFLQRHQPVGKSCVPLLFSTPEGQRVDVLDTTHMQHNVHKLRHSYFNVNVQIVADILDLVTLKLPAGERCSSRLVRRNPGENVFTFLCPPSNLTNA